ncbi:XRE family transcriptional regulator [Iodobacter sp. CM08]|uniref:helix-turn-helix domain-containing protein n=1 Tax=Iodobacter sp. CM08 TaxID=3085902 RepID=UPI002982AEAC|nr:XRE family transcriptional regulator [Iodobacter sp. CM08]MDW5419104.1 XRE family transcriptional regulator [Iodobacter sp. CM08]
MKRKPSPEKLEEHAYDKPSERVRTSVLNKIRALLATNSWTQQEAAHFCGLSQPRISDLCRGNTNRFSLDALVDIAAVFEQNSKPLEGSAMQENIDEGQRMVAEFLAKLAAKPVKARYPLATEDSTTERGGKIIATGDMILRGKRILIMSLAQLRLEIPLLDKV